MVLYQALSTYQIMECIEHRYKFHKNDECILLLGDYIVERFPNFNQLSKFFDRVSLFRFGGYPGEISQIVEEVECEFKKSVSMDLHDIDKFYVAGIHTYLQVLMIEENVPFEMFEDGSGALSRPWVLAEIHKKSAYQKYLIIKEYGLYDHSNNLITKKWCDFSAQLDGFHDRKAVDFNVLKEFKELPQSMQQSVLCFFGIDEKIKIEGVDTLLLTQQFCNLGQLSFEEHVLIYQNMFDYYLNNQNVAIKPHPDDIMYYSRLFPEAQIVTTKYPSELTPFVFENKPENIATVTSTGINLIQNEFSNSMKFDELYEKSFRYDYIYLVVLKLLEYLGIENISYRGIDESQIVNLSMTQNIFLNMSDSENVVICDDMLEVDYTGIMHSYLQGNIETVILCNSKQEYRFYEYNLREMFDRFSIFNIRKKKISDFEFYEKEGEHCIYVLSHNEMLREKMKGFNFMQEMKHTGVKLETSCLDGKDKDIKMLEGRLEATERRLVKYIESEKKLLERLKQYEQE